MSNSVLIDRTPSRLAAGILAAACLAWPSPARAEEPAEAAKPQDSSAAAELVQAAMENEVAGRDDHRQALLDEALRKSPAYAPAHWHSGQVLDAGKWRRPEEVERHARQDTRLAEFKRRRAEVKDLAGCVALARWCHKNHLADEEQVAWQAVLSIEPGHAEAIKALGLVAYQGQWLTRAEASRRKAQAQAAAKALEHWRPLVAAWRAATERRDSPAAQAVIRQIASISDSAEMLAVERVLWQQVGSRREYQRPYEEMVAALVAALGKSPQQPATESLARHAVFARSKEVRQAAIAALKERRPEGYVPLLLSGMATPLEFSAQVEPGAGGYPISRFSLFREGPLADERYTWGDAPVLSGDTLLLFDWNTPAALQQVADRLKFRPYPGTIVARNWPEYEAALRSYAPIRQWNDTVAAKKSELAGPAAGNEAALGQTGQARGAGRTTAAASAAAAQQDTSTVQAAVEQYNRQTAEVNVKIAAVLAQTTGKDFGDDPLAWWNWWWKQYNEMAFSTPAASASSPDGSTGSGADARPQYEYDNYRSPNEGTYLPPSSGYPPSAQAPPEPIITTFPHSCFARGTPVWTQSGLVPIEQVRPGDRVLAQDTASGELAYKPVLRVTVRPSSARIKIGLGTQSLTATPGHAFWVVGCGWRMAKQLAVGDRLHTPSGTALVESLQKVPASEAADVTSHNLVVADFGTYFVGQRGVLVHDIMPAGPATVALPGMRPGTAVAVREAAAEAGNR
jgi:hypothetical protein